MEEKTKLGMGVAGEVARGAGLKAAIGLKTHYEIECRAPDGTLKWREEFDNLVVNAGLNDNLDRYFKGSSYTAAWYVGLTAATPTPAAGDTLASHAGWVEFVQYDEATREALTLGTVSSQSVDNSASKAVFTIATNGSVIGGAFVTDESSYTESPQTGVLYGVGAFSGGNKSADDGDTISVTVTLTAAAA